MEKKWELASCFAKLAILATLAACGGGGGSISSGDGGQGDDTAPMLPLSINAKKLDAYTISGTLSGLDPGAEITLGNGYESLSMKSNGRFNFIKAVANESEYNVMIDGDLPFLQECIVKNGTGKIEDAPVSDIQVSCYPAPVTALYSFPTGPVNYHPVDLMQAKNGIFYGIATSVKVGKHALNNKTGYIFTISNGIMTTPNDACKTPDSWCFAGTSRYWNQPPVLPTGIMQAKNGIIYGTTFLTGTANTQFDFGGAIYKLDPTSKTFIQNDDLFPNDANAGPIADLIQDEEGYLYGVTFGNTWVDSTTHGGSIFKMTSDGSKMDCANGTKAKVCTLHAFSADDAKNGFRPNGRLTLLKNKSGNFLYGVTESGGANGKGVIFKFDLSRSKFDVIASFDNTEVFASQRLKFGQLFFYNPYERPHSGLMQATDGYLYGVTKYGGKNNAGRIFRIAPLTPYHFSVIYDFEEWHGYPAFELVQLKDGNLYGVTQGSGETGILNDMGAIFRIKTDGTSFTTLHPFSSDVGRPSTRLVIDNDGTTLYGGTQSGGSFHQGTIYKFGGKSEQTKFSSSDL